MTHTIRNAPTAGRATSDGTARYASRFSHLDRGHFRPALGLSVSSLGIGTYLGDPDEVTDRGYYDAVLAALAAGCNVIDTAVNYRYQFSERAVGQALRSAFESGTVQRDEVVVCTKGGFLSFDGPPAQAKAWVQETLIDPGIIEWPDIVAYNVMRPAYLRHQIEISLDNLGIETIDLYYLHNPESQLQGVSREEFFTRMAACFAELEMAVSAGMIAAYGVATWDAFRVEPDAQAFVSIADLTKIAAAVAPGGHHFRAIQLPVNLGMPEAIIRSNQRVLDTPVTAIEAATRLGLDIFASGSLMQGRLALLPSDYRALIPGVFTDPQRALQFVRSTPGVATALVGMKTPDHVRDNLALAATPPLTREEFAALFS